MASCPYKNFFGEPGEGVHAYRFFGIAVVDALLTILVAWMVSFYFNLVFWKVLLGLFIAGIVLHRLFCVRTTIDKLLTI